MKNNLPPPHPASPPETGDAAAPITRHAALFSPIENMSPEELQAALELVRDMAKEDGLDKCSPPAK